MSKIKIGIIGTGVGIRTHLKGFRSFEDDVEVLAISGSSKERSVFFANEYSIPVACSDYKELCDIENIDLVCITTPNKFHKEMLLYAVSKEKNIICEKPMAENLSDAKDLVSNLEGYKKLLIVDHQLRFNPYMREIKRMIDDGILGRIYSVKLNQQGMGFANENAKWTWSFDANEAGGVRLAMASHFTDLIDYWFDKRPVISVAASMNPVTKYRNKEDGILTRVDASTLCNAFIMLKDELTVQYSINAGSYSESRFDINIFGDKGELLFSLQDKLQLFLRNNIGHVIEVKPNGVYEDEEKNMVSIFSGSFRYLVPELISALKNGDYSRVKRAATPADSLYCMEILDAIKISANEGVGISFGKEKNMYV
jgi:Predicted dehydrogenases and related proteins